MVASILNTICDQRRKDVAVAKEQVYARSTRDPLHIHIHTSTHACLCVHAASFLHCALRFRSHAPCPTDSDRCPWAHTHRLPQVSLEQLKGQIEAANAEFPCINFKTRLREDAVSGVAVVAEIKVRAAIWSARPHRRLALCGDDGTYGR